MSTKVTKEQIARASEKGYTSLKSGQYKGCLSSHWVRDNSGPVIFTCPLCGGIIGAQLSYRGQVPCIHQWTRDHAGFRYRWLLQVGG